MNNNRGATGAPCKLHDAMHASTQQARYLLCFGQSRLPVRMQFYHDKDNAASYAAMAEGYDASEQLEALYKVLPEGSTVLELGSGPGNDLHLLAQRYRTTGSDYSPAFVDILKERFPDRRVLTLDAVSVATEGLFDAIFSNKVLQHLTDDELKASFCRQGELLSPGGYVFHLVWQHLVPPDESHGLIYQARDAGAMMAAMGSTFEMIEVTEFCEFDDGDSIAILARKVRDVS